MSIPTDGGTAVPVVTVPGLFDSGSVRGINLYTVDGASVYGGYGGYVNYNIFSAPSSGGQPTTITSTSSGYFLGESFGTIYFGSSYSQIDIIPSVGGIQLPVANGVWVRHSTMDSNGIYFQNYYDKKIYGYIPSTGALAPLTSSLDQEVSLFTDATAIFFNDFGTGISAISKQGGAVQSVVTGTNVVGYAAAENYVYYTNGSLIQKASVLGGASITLASVAGGTPTNLVTDGYSVYYTVQDTGTGMSTIKRISAAIPFPTATPPISDFPKPSSIYTPDLTSFLTNQGAEFSLDTQQLLIANSTPENQLGQSSWKNWALVGGTTFKYAGDAIDLIQASQSRTNAVKYVALSALPAKYQNFSSIVDIISNLGVDIAASEDPTGDLIAANAYIYGKWVSPQLLSFAQDPPDSRFNEAVIVKPVSPLALSSPDRLTAPLVRAFNDQIHAAQYLEASNTAYNRYATALADSDPNSAALQLESLLYYVNLFQGSMSAAAEDLGEVNSLLPQSDVVDLTYSPDGLSALQRSIQVNGLPADTVSFLGSIGLSQADIAEVTQSILNLQPNAVSGDLYSLLGEMQSAEAVPEPAGLALACIAGLFFLARLHRHERRERTTPQSDDGNCAFEALINGGSSVETEKRRTLRPRLARSLLPARPAQAPPALGGGGK